MAGQSTRRSRKKSSRKAKRSKRRSRGSKRYRSVQCEPPARGKYERLNQLMKCINKHKSGSPSLGTFVYNLREFVDLQLFEPMGDNVKVELAKACIQIGNMCHKDGIRNEVSMGNTTYKTLHMGLTYYGFAFKMRNSLGEGGHGQSLEELLTTDNGFGSVIQKSKDMLSALSAQLDPINPQTSEANADIATIQTLHERGELRELAHDVVAKAYLIRIPDHERFRVTTTKAVQALLFLIQNVKDDDPAGNAKIYSMVAKTFFDFGNPALVSFALVFITYTCQTRLKKQEEGQNQLEIVQTALKDLAALASRDETTLSNLLSHIRQSIGPTPYEAVKTNLQDVEYRGDPLIGTVIVSSIISASLYAIMMSIGYTVIAARNLYVHLTH